MKDFIEKNKFHVLGLVCVVIVFLLLVLIFGKGRTIIINGVDGVFVKSHGSWQFDRNISNYSGKKYDIYSDGKSIGNYYLNYSAGLNVYDSHNNIISYDYDLFAVSNRSDVDLIAFSMNRDDYIDDYVYHYINLKNIVDYGNSYLVLSYDYDFDGDGVIEKLISVSNHIDLSALSFFSAVFIVDDGHYYDVEYNLTSDISQLEIFTLNKIIDIKRDGKVEFIVDEFFYSQPVMHCQDIYQYSGKSSKKISKCSF